MSLAHDPRQRRARVVLATIAAVSLAASAVATVAARGAGSDAAAASTPGAAASGDDGCGRAYCVEDAVFQLAPLQSLLAGVLEGPFTFADAMAHGDFGIGGMSPLDGEAILVDGRAWHAAVDGTLREVAPSERTSVLFAKRFRADRSIDLPAVDGLDAFTAALDAELPRRNRIQAVRIDGRFARLRLRSVPRQFRPYVPVTEVVKSQQLLELADVDGTLVGFRFPGYFGGVNAAGWHFHFVDRERRRGGHLLDIGGDGLRAQLDGSRALILVLPDDPDFDAADLGDGGGDGFQPALRPGTPR